MLLSSSRSTRWLTAIAGSALIASTLLVASPARAVDGGSTILSLTAAIEQANAFFGPETISLTPGSTIFGGSEVTIADDVTIEMNGSTVENLRVRISGAAVTIRGGTWTALPAASSGAVAPGFGVSPASSLTLDGMFVRATGSECDAAIGGWLSNASNPSTCDVGDSVTGGAITINNSFVEATGGLNSAGIGGGSRGVHAPITITNSTVNVTGGSGGAAIGGGKDRPAGTITLTESTVTATGGINGSGIGGGEGGAGGTVTIDGGTVTATAFSRGAGIGGGGEGGAGGAVTITGDAIVTATGATFSAGIGGGFIGAGGTTSIGGTAVVTAIGQQEAPGIGSSYTATASGPTIITDGTPTLITSKIQGSFEVAAGASVTLAPAGTMVLDGTSTNAGTITVNAPSQLEIATGDTLSNASRIEGTGTLRGSGTVNNQGVICTVVDDSTLTVTGTAYELAYRLPGDVLEPLPVYAASLTSGCRSLLDISDSEQVLLGWRIGLGGPYITADTDLAANVPSGSAVLEPVLVAAELTFTPASSQSLAGETVQVQAFGPVPMSRTLSSNVTNLVQLSGDITLGTANGEFVSTTAGDQTITGTVDFIGDSGMAMLSGSFTHTTLPAPLDVIALTTSALTVDQGRSVTLQVTGQDAYGNAIAIDPADAVVTSSVPTDVIDGLTVTFPTASPHVLTVTVGELSAQVTVEVVPAAVIPPNPVNPSVPAGQASPASHTRLAVTGAPPLGDAFSLALLTLVLGPTLIALRRRKA